MGCHNIGHCKEKENFDEHVSNFECVMRQSCLDLSFESVRFLFVILNEERSLENKYSKSRLSQKHN